MKKSTFIISIALVLVLILTACNGGKTDSGGQGTGENEKIVIRLSHANDPKDAFGQGATKFAELVKEKTDGQVEIDVYDRAQLGKPMDCIRQMQMGALEMSLISSELNDVEDTYKVFELPYLFRDRDHVIKVFTGPIGEKISKPLEEHDLKVVGFLENGFRHITNNQRPIVVPSDLEGLKIRVPDSTVRVAMFREYGANPLSIAFSELYTSLQQGLIEAQENPYGNIWGNKLYEVQKYISESNHLFSPISIVIAKPYWDDLSPGIQEAMLEAAEETTIWQMNWAASQEEDWMKDMTDFGCEINKVDQEAFFEASQPVYDQVLKDLPTEIEKLVEEIIKVK